MSNISSTTDLTLSLIDDYISELSGKPASSAARGSLVFALDATGSREPTWDLAVDLQSKMFSEVAALGGLDVKLIFYRGTGRDAECSASGWIGDPARLAGFMGNIRPRAGITQLAKVLDHTIRESGPAQDQRADFHRRLRRRIAQPADAQGPAGRRTRYPSFRLPRGARRRSRDDLPRNRPAHRRRLFPI